ncbi:hypothetical protein J1N35_004098 [Gossypium stocksii]|uniref:Zinc knuckle CX2CX4HX4C domain-containing protein n=1 Tax=Gossypium stocksii TaxID=47602 RepID=A0A9D3WCZ7_9ROSI|nr:hypothetical protein J1N35_004098 [Gossypium stocksii]
MDEELANLSLLDEEEEALHGGHVVNDYSYPFCLVGRCLTDSVVHFPALRNTMADLWHPIGGICITNIRNKSHLLVLQRVQSGENPSVLDLNHTEFWVQIHELPAGMMCEPMAKQLGNFLGTFLEYDTAVSVLSQPAYMRIRVRLNVSAPLKRKKKIHLGNDVYAYVQFKYEKLSLFCFICGKLGHGESFYPFRLKIESGKISFGWDLSLRAVSRRRAMVVSRWLREADGSQCCADNMGSSNHRINSNLMIDSARNLGRNFGQQSNPNLIPLGPNQHLSRCG